MNSLLQLSVLYGRCCRALEAKRYLTHPAVDRSVPLVHRTPSLLEDGGGGTINLGTEI